MAFTTWISPTGAEHEYKKLLIRRMKDLIEPMFPGSTLLPFGSYETTLYLPTG